MSKPRPFGMTAVELARWKKTPRRRQVEEMVTRMAREAIPSIYPGRLLMVPAIIYVRERDNTVAACIFPELDEVEALFRASGQRRKR